MQHVDEGTLHALLDGELPAAEAAQVRLHFATCPSCSARLDEARQLLAETERLVSALELPDAAARAARPNEAPGSRAAAGTVADVLVPPPPSTPLPPLDPVVLIPENPTSREVRRSRLRYMAWAATVLVAVGAGYVGVTQRPLMQSRSSDAHGDLSPDEFTTVQGTPARPDSTATLALTDSDATAPPPRSALAKDAAAAAPAVPPKPDAPSQTPTQPPAASKPAVANRAEAREKRSEAPAAGRTRPAAPAPAPVAAAAPDQPPAEQLGTIRPDAAESVQANRQTAAEATAELDRRRTRERAAEATAALERQLAERRAAEERQRAAERAAATPAPAANADATPGPTRIGLDEAARQLGGPLHAIDGLPRQSVTLLPGNSIEGADPERPVVRAVYTDRSGVPLFLDQQMARPGQGPATPQTGRAGRQVWVKDGVLLILHGGNLTADSLKSLARRVR
jgi:putative zinc finger protein